MASYRKEHHDEKENKARNLKDDSFFDITSIDSFDDSFDDSFFIPLTFGGQMTYETLFRARA